MSLKFSEGYNAQEPRTQKGSNTDNYASLSPNREAITLTLSCYSEDICLAGDMAQWLKVFVALLENLGAVPSIHMVAYSHLYNSMSRELELT